MSKQQQDAIEQQHRRQMHSSNLQGQGDDTNVKALAALSQVDLDVEDDDVTQTWKSKVNSTAKLSEEKRISHEWEREITLIMALSDRPTEDGLHGSWQGWAHGDPEKAQEPMSSSERAKKEANLQTSNLALTRSDDGFVTKESLRGIKQSFVGDGEGDSSGGGILGRIGLK
jgi:hypothetical protein